jgi:hypothetical protein
LFLVAYPFPSRPSADDHGANIAWNAAEKERYQHTHAENRIRLARMACGIDILTHLSEPQDFVFIARVRFHKCVHAGHLNDKFDLVFDIYGVREVSGTCRAERKVETGPTSIIDQAHKGLTTRSVTNEDDVLSISQSRGDEVSGWTEQVCVDHTLDIVVPNVFQ